MSKHITARDLQAAFVEGAKFEYERLAKRFESHFGEDLKRLRVTNRVLASPLDETYNQRKDARYAAAAAAFPVPQKPRVVTVQLEGEGFPWHVRRSNGAFEVSAFAGGEGFIPYKLGDGSYMEKHPAFLRAIADVLEHPTEDAA